MQQKTPFRVYGVFSIRKEDAEEYVRRLFYPHGVICPAEGCRSRECTSLRGPRTKPGHFQCRSCRRIFSLLGLTPFRKSHVPLTAWLAAIHLWFRWEDDLYPKYLQDTLGFKTYKTAKMVLERVHDIMSKAENKRMFSALGDNNVAPPNDSLQAGNSANWRKGKRRIDRLTGRKW